MSNFLRELANSDITKAEIGRLKRFFEQLDLSKYKSIKGKIVEAFQEAAELALSGDYDKLLLVSARLELLEAQAAFQIAAQQAEFWVLFEDAAKTIARVALRSVIASALA